MWTNYRHPGRDLTQFESAGKIRLHTDGENIRKPGWLVSVKLVATVGMLAVGLCIVVPSIPMPPLQAFAVAMGILLLYIGVAYFIRPEPNVDNLGTAWGNNDRSQFNDDANRALLNLYMFLGPGRFVSETFIDAATLMGILAERTHADIETDMETKAATEQERRRAAIAEKVDEQFSGKEHQGTVALDSMRYLAGHGSQEESATPEQA